jgi:maleylpyruvate isomerase
MSEALHRMAALEALKQRHAEKAALIARQGPGARYDAPEAPAEALLTMRRGTAYVARLIDAKPDSALTGQTAATVAELGYHARALTRLLAGQPMWATPSQRQEEIALGATLPPRALRALFAHASRHLDVDMRDLPGPRWSGSAQDGTPIKDLPHAHARLLWQAALPLGGRPRDIPTEFRPPA